MDQLTAFVMVARRRLRLRRMLMAIERDPTLLENEMAKLYIPQPIELAGMRSRLLRAKEQEKDIAATGRLYDDVQNGIDEAHAALKDHVSDLKGYEGDLRRTIEGMLERSNGGPTGGGSDGRPSPSGEQQKAPAAPEVVEGQAAEQPQAEAAKQSDGETEQQPQSEPEKLTVNGVSNG